MEMGLGASSSTKAAACGASTTHLSDSLSSRTWLRVCSIRAKETISGTKVATMVVTTNARSDWTDDGSLAQRCMTTEQAMTQSTVVVPTVTE